MIPLFHDFEAKHVVVVGGGPVARRRARRFACEATVTVVAPSFADGFQDIDCELIQDRVTPDNAAEFVSDAYLVVVATDDPEINDAVSNAADSDGCLVNRADEAGEIVVPSTIETQELSVALSTRGSSPMTTKYLRQELTPYLEQADGMVRIQRAIRPQLKSAVEDQSERRAILRSVIEREELWDLLPDQYERAREKAQTIVEKRT